jgi:anti-sigma factor RsiW
MIRVVCWLMRRRLGAYRDGELASGVRARVDGHVAGCRACASELAALDRLRASLRAEVPELPEGAWDAFWPQVQARLAEAEAASTPRILARQRGGVWETFVGHPRLAFGSAVAATAVAVLAFLAPWQQTGRAPAIGPGVQVTVPMPSAPGGADVAGTPAEPPLVVQAVETSDPESSVMVFTNEDPGVTVVWVFGLERT